MLVFHQNFAESALDHVSLSLALDSQLMSLINGVFPAFLTEVDNNLSSSWDACCHMRGM